MHAEQRKKDTEEEKTKKPELHESGVWPAVSVSVATDNIVELSIRSVVLSSKLEVHHSPTEEDQTWARDVMHTLRRFAIPHLTVTIIEHDALCDREHIVTLGNAPAIAAAAAVDGGRELRAFSYPNTETGIVVVIAGVFANEMLCRRDRDHVARIAHLVETSYRLRREPELVKTVLDEDGRICEGEAPICDLWAGLVSGRYGLVETKNEEGRRIYLVVDAGSALNALTEIERAVLTHAVEGMSMKAIGYTLGLSGPTVSTRLAIAAAKLGAGSRTDAVRLGATLSSPPSPPLPLYVPKLTAAERDVLQLIRQGLTNDQIAMVRARSVRTVANQVASLLRKTQRNSRRALAAANRPAP